MTESLFPLVSPTGDQIRAGMRALKDTARTIAARNAVTELHAVLWYYLTRGVPADPVTALADYTGLAPARVPLYLKALQSWGVLGADGTLLRRLEA